MHILLPRNPLHTNGVLRAKDLINFQPPSRPQHQTDKELESMHERLKH